MTLEQWALKHGVSYQALQELRATWRLDTVSAVECNLDLSEAGVQSRVRLEAAREGVYLWRNNVGAMQDATGRVVRYGLANDSKKLNERIKSGDLIGVRPVFVQQQHVGTTIGQFVSREIKSSDWRYSNTEREQAQLRWAQLITSLGGDACFANGVGTL